MNKEDVSYVSEILNITALYYVVLGLNFCRLDDNIHLSLKYNCVLDRFTIYHLSNIKTL